MRTSSLKLLARIRLKKNFLKNTSVASLYILAYTLLSAYINNLLQRSNSVNSIVITYALLILFSLIFDVFLVGLYNYFLNMSLKREALFSNLLYGIKNGPDRIIGVTIIKKLVTFLPMIPGITFLIAYYIDKERPELFVFLGVLLAIVGAIISYTISLSFSQCFILLADDEELTAMQTVRKSFKLMKGNKEKLFIFHISFIPLFILGFLTMYIGFFLIIPYYIAALCFFNLDISGRITPDLFFPDKQ